jgi:hypothetical protein
VEVGFAAELWEHDGQGAWHFVTVPLEESEALRDAGGQRRGFGSLRVRAVLGTTTWETSVFPDRGGCFLLPVKRAVRRAEDVEAGDVVEVRLALLG